MAELIGPTFCEGPNVTPGKFMNDQNFKNKYLKVFFKFL